MKTTPLIPMITLALVGLGLAPSAAAKVYTLANTNKTKGDDWYVLVSRNSTGSMKIHQYILNPSGGSCEYKGKFPDDAPPAKDNQTFHFTPGTAVQFDFRPDSRDAVDFKVNFYVYDRNGKNGSFRYTVGSSNGGKRSVIVRREVLNPDWQEGNREAVQLQPMLQAINLGLPTWDTKTSVPADKLLDAVDPMVSFDTWTADMGDPRPAASAKASHQRLPSVFTRGVVVDAPAKPASHRRQQSSITVWVTDGGASTDEGKHKDGKHQRLESFCLTLDDEEEVDIDTILANADDALGEKPASKPSAAEYQADGSQSTAGGEHG